jgi:transposase InsO family protein
MSRKGNCWDNAVVESFFKTIKVEWIYSKSYANQQQAQIYNLLRKMGMRFKKKKGLVEAN